MYTSTYGGEVKWRSVALLMAITFKPTNLPFKYWPLLEVGIVDGDDSNVHPGNLVWLYPEGGIECDELPGYNYVPGFTRYVINRVGNLCTVDGRAVESMEFDKLGYIWFTKLRPDVGDVSTMTGRHRLLALAWLKYTPDVDLLQVNHIDAVPGNDELDNLEWVTRQGNYLHAKQLELYPNHTPVLSRNVVTGEVLRYSCLSDCAKAHGLVGDAISYRVAQPDQPVYSGYFQFKLEVDTNPWREVNDPDSELRKTTSATPVKVLDLRSNEVSMFKSQTEAATSLGIYSATINLQLTNPNCYNRPFKGYLFRFIDDGRPWPEFSARMREIHVNRTGRVTKPVICLNAESGEEVIYDSCKIASGELGIPYQTIIDAIAKKTRVRNKFFFRWTA